MHRCEVFQLHGAWTKALDSAREACERLAGPPALDTLGQAYYQLAEIERLKGDFAEADNAYRRASLAGRDPEPGPSLLRLAQGRIDLAVSALHRALAEAADPLARARLLPAVVEVRLESGEIELARAAADELREIAGGFDSQYLDALSAQAVGAVLVAEDDVAAGLSTLRQALRLWQGLEAPHDAARVRSLIGIACRMLGDRSSADLEFDAARVALTELGATPELRRRARVMAGQGTETLLSRRETEVLRFLPLARRIARLAPSYSSAKRRWPGTSATFSQSFTFLPAQRPRPGPSTIASSRRQSYAELPSTRTSKLDNSPEVGPSDSWLRSTANRSACNARRMR